MNSRKVFYWMNILMDEFLYHISDLQKEANERDDRQACPKRIISSTTCLAGRRACGISIGEDV